MSHARCACPKAGRRGRPNYALYFPPDLGSSYFRCLGRRWSRAYASRRPLPRSASPTIRPQLRSRYSLEVLPPDPSAREVGKPPGYTRTLHQPSGPPQSLQCRCKLNSGGTVRKGGDRTRTDSTRQAYATNTHGSWTQYWGSGTQYRGRQAVHGFVNARYAQRTQMRPQHCTRTDTNYRHPGPLSVVFSSRCVPG